MTFSAKNNEFDALSGALVKRIVEMNSGLTSFEEAKLALSMMQAQIEGISLELEKNQQIYLKSEEDIQSHLVDYSQEINGELISQTANLRENFVRLEGRFSVLNSKILDVEQVLESSQSTLSQVGAEARSLGEMKEVMDALLLLERERYFEVISGMSNDQSEAIPIANQVPGPAFTRTQ
jgi:chromosome segregation ATPase